MAKTITLKTIIPATPKMVYDAWLNSKEHTAMTGGPTAVISNEVGSPFTAHNAYLWGKNLELIPVQKIVQTWRTNGFKSTDSDSQIEITLKSHSNGTSLTLRHSNIPSQEGHVVKGWISHYFNPMKAYFKTKQ